MLKSCQAESGKAYRWAPIRRPCSQAFLAETVETGDKNRDDFPCIQTCIQMRLVMSMRPIFGDDWNDARQLITFLAVSQWCNFPRFEALDFCVILHVYYINTNEIPGELSRETCENNMLSSQVKISPLLWLHNKSRISHQKKLLKWNDLIVHWCLYNK